MLPQDWSDAENEGSGSKGPQELNVYWTREEPRQEVEKSKPDTVEACASNLIQRVAFGALAGGRIEMVEEITRRRPHLKPRYYEVRRS